MNYVISITRPSGLGILQDICAKLELPVVMSMLCRGTATKSMLDLLGMDSRERRLVMAVADAEKTKEFIRAHRRRLYIDAPGNGIIVSIPVKSVGGGDTLAYLNGGQPRTKSVPEFNYDYELILAIANEGHTDAVMDAARAAGARGGTVLHGKGTGGQNAEKFYKVSIASEKELIMIVAKTEEKTGIMSSILKLAGPATETGAIVFSLPVSQVAGFGMESEE